MDLQAIVEIDRQLLGVVNGAHSPFFDTLMTVLTSGPTWIPLYLSLLYLDPIGYSEIEDALLMNEEGRDRFIESIKMEYCCSLSFSDT